MSSFWCLRCAFRVCLCVCTIENLASSPSRMYLAQSIGGPQNICCAAPWTLVLLENKTGKGNGTLGVWTSLRCHEGRVVCPQGNLEQFSFGESCSSCGSFALKRCHLQQRTLAQSAILWSFVVCGSSCRHVLSFSQRLRFKRFSCLVKVISTGVVQQ